ncbi:hypothetical protein EZV76_12870 [Flagellimonas alvinocaridis]|uniref:Uncharacterized protein n=1 Tax=Flagellimonas alvinocaridis TaxID=2530200 RepID=A0A4V4HWR8_9FLAO|nr:hypothetical protein [Allomuricauda alvinocaridis]THV58166.1 hypothetical protein EZV76_12870 [Allomuricauda alvinocaridis]
MDTFRADATLESVLLGHGFVETTSARDRLKGKKSFKLSRTARKEIYFDYEHIRILESSRGHDACYRLTAFDLRSLLWFFKAGSNDLREVFPTGRFRFDTVGARLERIRAEWEALARTGLHRPRRSKLQRILDSFDQIQFN